MACGTPGSVSKSRTSTTARSRIAAARSGVSAAGSSRIRFGGLSPDPRPSSCGAHAKWIRSPSNRYTPPKRPLHSRTALSAIVSNTGWVSVGDWLITRRISAVAVCCSRASVRSAFLVCSSVSSRAFSMAMAAWSAKVSIRAIWLSVNGRTSCRLTAMTPSSSFALQHGDRQHGPDGGHVSHTRGELRVRLDIENVDRAPFSAARPPPLPRPGADGILIDERRQFRGRVVDGHDRAAADRRSGTSASARPRTAGPRSRPASRRPAGDRRWIARSP